ASDSPPDPVATKSEPFHARFVTPKVNGELRGVQTIPSGDVANPGSPPIAEPPATQYEPFHAMDDTKLKGSSNGETWAVHVVPSGDVAMVVDTPSEPPDTHIDPFHARPATVTVSGVVTGSHVVVLTERASVTAPP